MPLTCVVLRAAILAAVNPLIAVGAMLAICVEVKLCVSLSVRDLIALSVHVPSKVLAVIRGMNMLEDEETPETAMVHSLVNSFGPTNGCDNAQPF